MARYTGAKTIADFPEKKERTAKVRAPSSGTQGPLREKAHQASIVVTGLRIPNIDCRGDGRPSARGLAAAAEILTEGSAALKMKAAADRHDLGLGQSPSLGPA